jgi:hypothetical protein
MLPVQVKITDIIKVEEGFKMKIVKYEHLLDEDDEDEDEDFVSIETGDTTAKGRFVYFDNDLRVGDLLELSFKKVIQVKG